MRSVEQILERKIKMKKRGFTLIELLVVIAIIAMLLAILMPALNKVKKIAQRVVCGTNLKGFGNAMTVYANDFDGQYVCQGQGYQNTWGDRTQGWTNSNRVWSNPLGEITVGASLYLLVRLADVSPKSFVCPASDQVEFSGKNPNNLDIVELQDFGQASTVAGFDSATMTDSGPAKCVSYSYHQPYMGTNSTGQAGRFRADDTRSAAFAVMADRNPWYDPKMSYYQSSIPPTSFSTEKVGLLTNHWDTNPNLGTNVTTRQAIQVANAQPHEREGQNVMFADGHASFEKTSDVGIKNDNIYTPWVQAGTDPLYFRKGLAPGGGVPTRAKNNNEEPKGLEDSFLVNDFYPALTRTAQ